MALLVAASDARVYTLTCKGRFPDTTHATQATQGPKSANASN